MRAISVVGFKNSGKTTLAVELCRALSARGVSVAGAKCSHDGFDRRGSDTSRLAEVCEVVAGVSPDEAMVLWPRKMFLMDLLPLLDADVLVVEGGKGLHWLPRIIVPRQADEAAGLSPELALGVYGRAEIEGLDRFDTVEMAADAVLSRGFALPGLDCGECGLKDCKAMSAAIVAGKMSPADCAARTAPAIRVKAGGAELGMKPFVEEMVSGAILGMLKSLKGFQPGRIEIVIDPESKG